MLQCAPADSYQEEFRSISTASSSTGFSRNVDTEADEKEEEEEVDSDDQWSAAKISRDTHVNLCGQGLTSLPSALFRRDAIAVLNLSNNSLREVPAEMSRFSSLESLDLSKNNFGYEDVQGRVGFFARKRRPKISGDLLPSSLAKLTNLRQLKMSSCGLRKIPPVVFQLISLRLLDISRNSIDTMPAQIGELGELRHLDASHTLLLKLPAELSMCTKMKHIKIFATKICEFSDEYSKFTRLRLFDFNFSALLAPGSKLDKEERASTKTANPPESSSEPAAETAGLPTFIFKLPNLRELNLQRCHLQRLPEDMSQLISLRTLDLSRNDFRDVPDGLRTLGESLCCLNLSRNPFQSQSNRLVYRFGSQLRGLKKLFLRANSLKDIDEQCFMNLGQLRELDLSENHIERLPAGIFNGLDNLRTLNLAKNAFVELPDSIGGLINLSTLDLTTNKLRDIKFPMEHLVKLYDMHSYRDLKRHGLWLLKNPLNQVPSAVWQAKTTVFLREYLEIRRLALHQKAAAARVFVLSSNHSMKVAFLSSLTTHFSGYQSFPPGIFINLIRRFSSQQKDPDDFRLLHQQTRVSSHHLTSPTGQRITFISLPFSPEPSSKSPAHARSNALFGHLIRPDSFLLVLLHLSSWQAEESEFENLRRTAYSYLQALQLRAPGALLQFLVLLQNGDHMASSARVEIGGKSGRREADYKPSPTSSFREVKLSTLMKRVEASVQSAIEDFAKSLSMQPVRIQIVSLVGIMLRPLSDSPSSPNDYTSVTRNLRQVPQTKATRISLQNSKHSSLLRTMRAEEDARVFCRLQTLRTFLLHCERCFCVDEAYRPAEDICPPDWELALCRNQQRHRNLLFIPLERLEIDYHSGRTGSFDDLQTYLKAWTKLGRALWLERHHFLRNYVIFRVDTFCELSSLLINADSLLACYAAHLTADPRHFCNRISALADISVEETQLCFRLLHKDGKIPSPLVRVLLADDIVELCAPLLHSKPRKSRTHRGRTRRRVASSLQSVDLVSDQELSTKLRPLPNSLVEKLKEILDLGFELTRGDASARHSEVSFFYTGTNFRLKVDSQLALADSADAGVKKDILSVTAPKGILDILFDRILTEIYANLRGASTVIEDPTSNLPSTKAQKCLRRAEVEFQNGSILIEDCCLDESVSEPWGEGHLLVSVRASAGEPCLESTAEEAPLSTEDKAEGGVLANLDELLQKAAEDFRIEFPGRLDLAAVTTDD